MKWIKVSDQEPPMNTEVLVWNGLDVLIGALILFSRLSAKEWCGDEWSLPYNEVTHWMPLPEKP